MGHTALQLSKPDFFHWPQLQLEDRFGIAVEQDKTGARLGGHHVYFRLRHMDLQNVSKVKMAPGAPVGTGCPGTEIYYASHGGNASS